MPTPGTIAGGDQGDVEGMLGLVPLRRITTWLRVRAYGIGDTPRLTLMCSLSSIRRS